jgi:hypothetical protein
MHTSKGSKSGIPDGIPADLIRGRRDQRQTKHLLLATFENRPTMRWITGF